MKTENYFSMIFFSLIFSFSLQIINSYSQQSITWQRLYDGPYNSDDIAMDVCEVNPGIFCVAGFTQGTLYVLKIDSLGDTIWTKLYPGNNLGGGNVSAVRSNDGGCVIASEFILKLDNSGNVIWEIDSVGRCYDIIRTNDNGYIACGEKNIFRGYIIKIDSTGLVDWEKTYTSGYSRYYYSIVAANDGGYLVTGTSNEYQLDTSRGLLTKINDTGNVIWEQKHKIMNKYASIHSIVSTSNGYAIVGNTDDTLLNNGVFSNVFFGRIDNVGNLIFSKVYYSDRNEDASCMKKASDNNFIFTFQKGQLSLSDSTYANIFLIDSLGVIETQKSISSPDEIIFNSLLTINNGDIIFVGDADFLQPGGNTDIYLIRTDSLLNYPPNIIGIEVLSTEVPAEFILHQNYPNPFNPQTTIKYDIPRDNFVIIKIYDLLGREIFSSGEFKKAGSYEVKFDGSNYASGMYFYTLESGNFKDVKKMVLLK